MVSINGGVGKLISHAWFVLLGVVGSLTLTLVEANTSDGRGGEGRYFCILAESL